MKICPTCRRTYSDETLNFCLDDGSALLEGPGMNEAITLDLAPEDKPVRTGVVAARAVDKEHRYTNSIAVLPFANLSADEENEYFCDGLADELLNALARIDDLNVAARTSAFAFKGRNANVSEIAKTLRVGSILEGSVRKSGERVRITVQLINAANGYRIWSERYDREMSDIFDVQDEIALAIVDSLKVKLLGDEKAAVLRRYTDNFKVYELYLQGCYHYYKYTAEGWLKAIEFFERTINAEPGYAPAHAKLSAATAFCWFFGILSADDAVGPWKSAARKALELDPRMDAAYESLGRLQFYYEWNWPEAERSFRRGLELNPGNAELHSQYGLCLVAVKRIEEALREGAKALELDPLSIFVNLQVGWLYIFSGRVDDSLDLMRKIIEMEPNSSGAHLQIGSALTIKRKLDEALEAYEKSWGPGELKMNLANLGSGYAFLGRQKEASEVLEQLLEMKKHEPVAALDIARLLSAMGEVDRSLEWLDKAVNERNGGLVFLRSSSSGFTSKTRSDPRFDRAIERIELPL